MIQKQPFKVDLLNNKKKSDIFLWKKKKHVSLS